MTNRDHIDALAYIAHAIEQAGLIEQQADVDLFPVKYYLFKAIEALGYTKYEAEVKTKKLPKVKASDDND